MADRILAETRFLRLVDREGWSFVERPNSNGVVTIVPLTRERRLLFVQQYRAPLDRQVIEFPAGLMGDESGHEAESPVLAARRELIEETGYQARDLEAVASTATSPGMANELVHFVLAWNLDRVGSGGGVAGEKIVVHEVSINDARAWLREQERLGFIIAAKVYAGLYFAHERWGGQD
jgi:ADP-ribose pyrophosphatase